MISKRYPLMALRSRGVTSDFEGQVAGRDESHSALFGRRYVLPAPVNAALDQVFAESVGGVIVIERSRYARLHRGVCATTRPNRILLAISGAEFVADPELLLHEYFHVVRQWRTAQLTRWRYVVESARRRYWENRYEREAREFAAGAVEQYLGWMRTAYAQLGWKRATHSDPLSLLISPTLQRHTPSRSRKDNIPC